MPGERLRVAMTFEQSWHTVPGGTAVAAIETARALARDPALELVGVAAAHRRPPPAHLRPPVRTFHLPLPRVALYEAWHVLRRPPVERATGPVDLVHATGVAVPPRTAPLVYTLHDLAFLDYPQYFSRAGLRFFRQALALAKREADVVLCASLATLEHCVRAGFDRGRLRHVPLGADAEPATDADVARTRARYGLERDYVLWTGTIEPRKNVPSLLTAFREVDGDVDLALVGPAGWQEDMGRLLAGLPAPMRARVRPLGFVPGDDLRALYAGAAVFCYPSLLEGFGLPVLEAMAQGTAVVTSKGTSTEEVAGDTGVLVDPRDTGDIATGIRKLLGDPALRARLGEQGRRRAAEFSWARTAQLVREAYNEALTTRR